MALSDDLDAFYAKNGFGPEPGKRPRAVKVYTGCLLVPMPNIETRSIYLKYHDLHHMATGFSVGRIGEGRVSAWELGTGSFLASPLLGIMNLIALSTGLFLDRRKMVDAFALGCSCSNAYSKATRAAIDEGRFGSIGELRAFLMPLGSAQPRPVPAWRWAEFGAYCAVAVAIHAAIAIPAMILRVMADKALGMTLFESLAPKRRTDLH